MLLLFAVAQAETGPEVLALMDQALTRGKDHTIGWEVVNQEPGKSEPAHMSFDVQVKGTMNLTEFRAPADLKGTRVLTMSRTQMYIYLPAYAKVRRIASHVTQQGFMGTTYSYDDMNGAQYGDIYDATLASEDAETWSLSMTSKGEAPYSKVEMTVHKKMHQPLQMKYFNDKGQHLKTETRSGYECRENNVCLAAVMRMEDHTRTGAWTELRRTSWQLNTGLDDEVFSVRNLQRGE